MYEFLLIEIYLNMLAVFLVIFVCLTRINKYEIARGELLCCG